MNFIDPLAFFPSEISEIIFNKLSVEDLKESLLVSSSWNLYIAKSKILTKKFKLNFFCDHYQNFPSKIISNLMNSERIYENLEIKSCMKCLKSLVPFLNIHEWKNVKISLSCFEDSEQASEFFKKIHKTVEILEVKEVYVKNAFKAEKSQELKFSKLKVLRTENIQSFLYYDIFANIKTLEEFQVVSNTQNFTSLNTILDILKVNKNLKKLDLSGKISHQIFYHNLTEFSSLNLEKISICGLEKEEDYQNEILENFKKFIESQKSLKEISILKWINEEILKAIFKLEIEKLEISDDFSRFSLNDWENLNLPENSTIKTLKLDLISHNTKITKKLIKKLPNLEHYICKYSDENFMEFLDENGKKLKTLEIEFLNVGDYGKYKVFKTIERIKVENCMKSMEGKPKLGKFQ